MPKIMEFWVLFRRDFVNLQQLRKFSLIAGLWQNYDIRESGNFLGHWSSFDRQKGFSPSNVMFGALQIFAKHRHSSYLASMLACRKFDPSFIRTNPFNSFYERAQVELQNCQFLFIPGY